MGIELSRTEPTHNFVEFERGRGRMCDSLQWVSLVEQWRLFSHANPLRADGYDYNFESIGGNNAR